MKILKRWHVRTFEIADITVDLRLKALTKAEAIEFLRGLASIGRQARDVDPTDEDAVVAGLRRLQGDFVREAFRDYVQLAEEIGREDGGRIETAVDLLDELPTALTFEILLAIQSLCVATETQGKVFASRYTSSAEGSEPGSLDSLVSNTTAEDGTAHSIAPPTPPNGAASTGPE